MLTFDASIKHQGPTVHYNCRDFNDTLPFDFEQRQVEIDHFTIKSF